MKPLKFLFASKKEKIRKDTEKDKECIIKKVRRERLIEIYTLRDIDIIRA